jgi:hypothetical protein
MNLQPTSSPPLNGTRFLKSSVVMTALGYRNRCAFWEFVRRQGVPHVRLNARRILFDEQALADWLNSRSAGPR